MLKHVATLATAFLLLAPVPLSAQCDDHDFIWVDKGVTPTKLQKGRRAPTPHKKVVTINGVIFDSNYDNASLGDISASGSDGFNVSLHAEDSSEGLGPRSYWFRWKMTNVANRSLNFNITHTQSPRPWVRVNDGEWRQMTSSEAPNTSSFNLSFDSTVTVAEVAFYEPYGYQETIDAVTDIVVNSPYAEMEVLGMSFEGRDLHLVTVTDPTKSDEGKVRVWLHSRAHAGEVTSTHTMVGFLEKITENTPAANRLRTYCIFNIVPLLNVDGTHLGHTRWDSQGIDPERQWCEPITHPEVLLIKAKVDEFMASENPIAVALNLHSTVGDWTDTFFFKHIFPSVTVEFEDIQQDFIDAFDNATPLFDNLSAQTSQLNACRFIESYFWNNWDEDVMALTHEGHFRRRITDSEWITGDDYATLGEAQAQGLIEYFDLPETSYNPPPVNQNRWAFW